VCGNKFNGFIASDVVIGSRFFSFRLWLYHKLRIDCLDLEQWSALENMILWEIENSVWKFLCVYRFRGFLVCQQPFSRCYCYRQLIFTLVGSQAWLAEINFRLLKRRLINNNLSILFGIELCYAAIRSFRGVIDFSVCHRIDSCFCTDENKKSVSRVRLVWIVYPLKVCSQCLVMCVKQVRKPKTTKMCGRKKMKTSWNRHIISNTTCTVEKVCKWFYFYLVNIFWMDFNKISLCWSPSEVKLPKLHIEILWNMHFRLDSLLRYILDLLYNSKFDEFCKFRKLDYTQNKK
jgi:hypothetical protein